MKELSTTERQDIILGRPRYTTRIKELQARNAALVAAVDQSRTELKCAQDRLPNGHNALPYIFSALEVLLAAKENNQ